MNEILSLTACSCHVIDPSKFQILLWKRHQSNFSDTYLLKIADQRFIGLVRTDKKGESYWKFKDLAEDQLKTEQVNNSLEIKETNEKSSNTIENHSNS